jgi:drug/metabolite transporter (DMT)-like permease
MSDPIPPISVVGDLIVPAHAQPAQVRLTGAGLCALSAAGFATLAILGKFAFANGMSMTGFLSLRFGGAAFLLAGYLFLTRRQRIFPGIRLGVILFTLGALGYFTQSSLYFLGLQRVSASLSSILLYVYPIFVALLAWAVKHQAPARAEWAAMASALTGVALTVGRFSGGAVDALGVIFVLGSAAGYSIYILACDRFTPRAGPLMSTAFITAGAAFSFAVTGFLTRTWVVVPTPQTIGILLGLILFSTIIPLVTFLAGLARVGPTAASLLSTLEPVFTVILAVIFLRETLAPTQLLGAGLVLSAVVLLNLPRRMTPAPPAG